MKSTTHGLMGRRRFLPLFVTQFLGAFNDNLFKNALVIWMLFSAATASGGDGRMMVTLAAGVFIMPFFIFSATAGQLADQGDKSRLIQKIKLGEIVIMMAAALGFMMGHAWILMGVLFLMGTQSAFFGPLKYGILPDHLKESELMEGNAWIETGTFLAILLGTMAGGLMILGEGGGVRVSVLAISLAVLGWWGSRFIPPTPAAAPTTRLDPNILRATWSLIQLTARHRGVFVPVLGISWFWWVGAMFLAQFPAFAKDVVGGNEAVVTLFLVAFSVGIGVGSLWCNRLASGRVDARYTPLGALGITLFSVDLFFASPEQTVTETLMGAAAFLEHAGHWRLLGDLFAIAVSGGVFIVPLYAMLQVRADPAQRARIIAGNNIINAGFMVLSALVTMALMRAGFSIPEIFLTVALANLVVALTVCVLLTDVILKGLFYYLFRVLYRLEVHGLEHVEAAGEKAVIAVNHVSFLDAALLAAVLPGRPAFAINTQMAKKLWIKPFLSVVEAIPLDPTNPMALRSLARIVKQGRRCVIFPEGRITVTGALMKVYEGPGILADRAQAPLIPVRIHGAEMTIFSRLKGKVRQRWFPKITLHVMPPQRFTLPKTLTGRARRRLIGAALYDRLCDMLVQTAQTHRTLFQALLDARTVHGSNHPIVEDLARKPMGYGRLITASLALGKKMGQGTQPGEIIALMLPNALGAVLGFFALQAVGRVPAMLNFSSGQANLISALETGKIRRVVTSRHFIEKAKLEETLQAMAQTVEILYLEDVVASLGRMDRIRAFFASLRASHGGRSPQDPERPAVVLFTSGSEGRPKGVVLSHRNLLVNAAQLASRVDYNPSDVVFNAMPIFHAFGLTGGLLLPVLAGIRTFLYPSPLHYRIIPELVYDTNATILFGTDTFLSGYARMANPYDFYSVRHLFAGAEKVRDETHRVWAERFGVRILEGYGTTETSPALSANTPMHCRVGTVGRMLPGIAYRLDPVPGMDEGGRLVVKGANVMLGYMRWERPGVLEPPPQGEYDTGDIVSVDAEGFVKILGRAKRFAKIAGEMVSLARVEAEAHTLWPEGSHAVIALPDPKKGEHLVLLTTAQHAKRETFLVHARARGLAEIMVPKSIMPVDAMPLLGSGKTDFVTAKRMVKYHQ